MEIAFYAYSAVHMHNSWSEVTEQRVENRIRNKSSVMRFSFWRIRVANNTDYSRYQSTKKTFFTQICFNKV
jgi:hypothetical protein